MPLTVKSVIWLQADELLEKLERVEAQKMEMKIQRERFGALTKILADLRHIQLSKMYFKTDHAFRDFLTTLPSYDGDARKNKEERRWKVKKRKPGEIPEWKKQRLADISADVDKKTG